MKIENKEVLGR